LLGVVLRTLLEPRAESRDLVISHFVPVIDMLVGYVQEHGKEYIEGVPVRAAILQLIMTHLARAAMADQAESVWGRGDHTEAVTRALLVRARPAAQ
jgi:hypothetical protein